VRLRLVQGPKSQREESRFSRAWSAWSAWLGVAGGDGRRISLESGQCGSTVLIVSETSTNMGSASFHAHVFFDLGEEQEAEQLRSELVRALHERAVVGPVFGGPAGRLPKPSFQVEYPAALARDLEAVIVSLCGGRSVLFHPVLEDEGIAHNKLAHWYGPPLALRMDRL
jgi:aromatic ring-cleaving dioxygenase